MGSFAATHDAGRVESRNLAPLYTASKAAVTMLTTQYAKSQPDVKVNAADPGYTATDFNGHSGPQTVTEGTDAIVELATIGADGPTGTFHDRHGETAWWSTPVARARPVRTTNAGLRRETAGGGLSSRSRPPPSAAGGQPMSCGSDAAGGRSPAPQAQLTCAHAGLKA